MIIPITQHVHQQQQKNGFQVDYGLFQHLNKTKQPNK